MRERERSSRSRADTGATAEAPPLFGNDEPISSKLAERFANGTQADAELRLQFLDAEHLARSRRASTMSRRRTSQMAERSD